MLQLRPPPIIAARVTPVREVEAVALKDADGRILAHDISAPLPLPPFTNSAVDGYAVRGSDLPRATEAAFAVTGRVQAGSAAGAALQPPRTSASATKEPLHRVWRATNLRYQDAGRACPVVPEDGGRALPHSPVAPAVTR